MFKGLVWTGIEHISEDVVSFILGIILARILTPEEYGIVGILVVFLSFSSVFIDSGFDDALVQKIDRNEDDKSTVFLFNITIATLSYVVLFFAAPFIADFYGIVELKELLRVLALILVINSFGAVHETLLSIELDFKTLSKINLSSRIIAGLIAIWMAYNGYGVWALAAQQLIDAVLGTILTWIYSNWRPNLNFSIVSLRKMFKYGSNLLVSELLGQLVNQISTLFIAKYMSTKDLGYYSRGNQLASTASGTLGSMLGSVIFPGLVEVQKDHDLLIRYNKSIIKLTAFVVFPIFFTLAILAEPLIRVLLTDKWLAAVPIMQLMCIARSITFISGINLNILSIIGRTDLELKQQYIKLVIRILFLLIGLQFGIVYVALAELCSAIVNFFVNTYYPGRIMSYGAKKQLSDLIRVLAAACAMSSILFLCIYHINSDILQLILGPIIALFGYFVFIKIFRIKEYDILVGQMKGFLKRD